MEQEEQQEEPLITEDRPDNSNGEEAVEENKSDQDPPTSDVTGTGEEEVQKEETKEEKKEETKENDSNLEKKQEIPPPAGLEEEVGYLRGEYPCSHNHIQGTLYAGSEGFTFTGVIFFYTSHFSFKWSKVSHVHQNDLGHIIIQAKKDNRETPYTFANMQHADRVWSTLVVLHSESNQITPRKQPLLAPMHPSFRRLSTDPTPITHVGEDEEGDEAAYVAAAAVAAMDDLRSSMSSGPRRMSSILPEEPAADLEEAWGQLHDNPNESYKDIAIEKNKIACSLDKFRDLFLADNAPHSIGNFMSARGDFNLTSSHWKVDSMSSKSRTIEYSHPINAPLAPPHARARKEQRMRFFTDQGISIETDTYVDDVPLTDCFYVSDRILISANEEGNVTIEAYFDIRFVKSTMFRSIIANTTRSEFVKWFQDLLAMVRKEAELSVEEAPPEPTKPTVEVPEPVLYVPPPKMAATTQILIGLVSLVLLLQVYIIHQMNGMQNIMVNIQAQQAGVCVLPQIVRNAVLNDKECAAVMAEAASASEPLKKSDME